MAEFYKTYNNVRLHKEETKALIELENMIGEEIPFSLDSTVGFRFMAEDDHIKKLRSSGRELVSLPDS